MSDSPIGGVNRHAGDASLLDQPLTATTATTLPPPTHSAPTTDHLQQQPLASTGDKDNKHTPAHTQGGSPSNQDDDSALGVNGEASDGGAQGGSTFDPMALMPNMDKNLADNAGAPPPPTLAQQRGEVALSSLQAAWACEGDDFVTKVKPHLAAVMDQIVRFDPQGNFLEPVNTELAPGYLTVIKTPMALTTIRGKLEGNQYDSWRGFVHDIDLVCKNAMRYNQKRSRIHRAAMLLQRKCKKILHTLQIKVFPPPPRTNRQKKPPAAALPVHASAAEAAAAAAAATAVAAAEAAIARDAAQTAQTKMLAAAKLSAEAAAAMIRGDGAPGPAINYAQLQEEASEAVSLAGTDYGATDSDGENEAHFAHAAHAAQLAAQQRRRRAAQHPPVTDEWRDYRQTIEWRCRWLELRMRELQAQRRHYERLELQLGERKREWEATSSGLEAEERAAKCEEGADSKAARANDDQPMSSTGGGDDTAMPSPAAVPTSPGAGATGDNVQCSSDDIGNATTKQPRVHFGGGAGDVLKAVASHALLSATRDDDGASAPTAAPEDGDASVNALYEQIAILQDKVETLGHQLRQRRQGEAPPLLSAPPRRLPRVPLKMPPVLGGPPAATAMPLAASNAGNSDDYGVAPASSGEGGGLKRIASATSAEKERKRRRAAAFDLSNVIMPSTGTTPKAITIEPHETIETPRVRLLAELISEETTGAGVRALPGWCDGPANPATFDAGEALDDDSFLLRHSALEAVEKARYAQATAQADGGAVGRAQLDVGMDFDLPPLGAGVEDVATKGRNVLVIRRPGSDAALKDAGAEDKVQASVGEAGDSMVD